MTQHFNEQSFNQEVIETSKAKPVLVDFFATWCGPCQMQAPIIDEIDKEMGEKVVVGKINAEEAPEISNKYNVMSLPTLLIFKDGTVVKTYIGLQYKDGLIEDLNKYL
jgi:thioredoxin 1